MDYGLPVRFGVFITPDATQPDRPLALAELADELRYDLTGVQDHGADDPDRPMRRFAKEVAPRVPESVAKARA